MTRPIRGSSRNAAAKPYRRSRSRLEAAAPPAAQAELPSTEDLQAEAEALLEEMLPGSVSRPSKIDLLVALLRRPEGATIVEMQAETGWQAHSVRGALAAAIKRGRAVTVASKKTERGRIYWIVPEVEA